MIYGWSPGIGDPTVLGWFTVFAYFAAAILCLRAGMRDWRSARLWVALFFALIFLGINKQLDLQSLVTAIGRHWAMTHNWYAERQWVQYQFIVLVMFAALVFCVWALIAVRRRSAALKGACTGLILLCAFIVVRATSFEHLSTFLGTEVLNLYWNHVFELGGIAIIAGSAACARRPQPGKRRRRRRRSRDEELLDEPDWLAPRSRR